MNVVAVAFRLLRLLLAVTIWSCHAWVAPTYRLCHVLAAATFGLRSLRIDRNRIAAVISLVKALPNWSLRGVKRLRGAAEANSEIPRFARNKLRNLKKNEIATPSGLAMTCQKSKCACINCSKLGDSRERVIPITSIPKIWSHGVMGTRVQEKIIKNKPSDPRTLEPLNPSGFTLIELIVVMIIIGILAATVLPRIDFGGTSSTASAGGAAYMIASDIRYTQECAMANRISKSIVFTNGSSTYTFSPVSTGMDPSGQLQSIGATIGTTVTFTFNSLGEPIAGGGSSVTVSAGGITRPITVTQYTGKVSY